MAIRSQVYEWTNLAPVGSTSSLTRTVNDVPVALLANRSVSIFTGGIGYNITNPAKTTATQFVVIENIGCTPSNPTNKGGAVQLRLNTTSYFENPDTTASNGVPGRASPYPRGISDGTINYLKNFDLVPEVYVLSGQVWDIVYTTDYTLTGGTGGDEVWARRSYRQSFVRDGYDY